MINYFLETRGRKFFSGMQHSLSWTFLEVVNKNSTGMVKDFEHNQLLSHWYSGHEYSPN